jgi:hypothetical protein
MATSNTTRAATATVIGSQENDQLTGAISSSNIGKARGLHVRCATCGTVIRRKCTGQRFCSQACRQAAFRRRTAKNNGNGVTQKRRLYPPTASRHRTAVFANGNNGKFLAPTYCFVSPTARLSDVEIAALGGFVVVKLARARP